MPYVGDSMGSRCLAWMLGLGVSATTVGCSSEQTSVTSTSETETAMAASNTDDPSSSSEPGSMTANAMTTDDPSSSSSSTTEDPSSSSSTTVADSWADSDDCVDTVCFSGTECFPADENETDGDPCPACREDEACSSWFEDADSLGCGNGCGGWYCSYDLSEPLHVDGQCCYDLTAWDVTGNCSTTG